MSRRPQFAPDVIRAVWAHLRNRDQRPRAQLPEGRGTFRIVDEAGVAEVYLYEEIGYWGVQATDFVEQLLGIAASRIVLHINSPGGDVFDGVAMYNALVDHPAAVEVKVDGWACSAASFIAQAGDTRTMNRGSQMMIHDASGWCGGNAAAMHAMGDLLDRVSDTIADIYAARAGGDADSWREAMRAESWYSAAEAVTAGLADTAVAEKPPADGTTARFNLQLTSFQFCGRAAAPRPPMPGREEPADELPIAPGVDKAPTNGDRAAPHTEPAAPSSPAPEDQPDWSQYAAAFRTAVTAARRDTLHLPPHTQKEAAT